MCGITAITFPMTTQLKATLDLPGIKKLRSGKVREVFDLGETLLFVVTDRLSAFDVILPDPIPDKGAVLNQISAFWFKHFDKIDNHFITADFEKFPSELRAISRATRRPLDDREENKTACRSNASCAVISPAPVGRNIRKRRAFAESNCPPVCNSRRNCRNRFSRLRPKRSRVTTRTSTWTECRRMSGRRNGRAGQGVQPANLFRRPRTRRRTAASSSPTRNSNSERSAANCS